MKVFDAIGQVISVSSFVNKNALLKIKLPAAKGIYNIQVSSGGTTTVSKVIHQ